MGFILKWTFVAFYITLRQECLGQTKLVPEGSTEKIKKIAITDKSYDNIEYTQTPSTPTTISYTIHEDQNEIASYREHQFKKYRQIGSNVSETKDKDKIINEHLPTMDGMIHFWNKFKNNTKVLVNDVLPDVSNTSPTTETAMHSNNGHLHSKEMEYFKRILGGYLAYQNITIANQITTKGQDDGDFVSQKSPEDLEIMKKLQGSSGPKTVLRNQNVSLLPYNVGEQMTRNVAAVDTLPHLSVNNADFIDSNYNFLAKGGFTDLDPRNMFTNPIKLDEQLKLEPVLINEPSQEEMNIESLVKNMASPLHTNKRELSDLPLHKTNSQLIRKLSGAAASDFFPRISDIGQSSHNNEHDTNDISLMSDKPRVYNNNFIEKSKDTTHIGALEDWYSSFFRNNMEIPASVASRNKQKELVKETLFDATYNSFNNDNKQVDKSKERYLEYNQIRDKYKPRKITSPIPSVEPESDVFDINSLFNNDYRATERSKDLTYPDFNTKGFHPDFASYSPLPFRENDEESVYALDRSNKNAAAKSSFLLNNPKLEDFNSLNSPKNSRYKNEGELLDMNRLENYHYEQTEEINYATFVGIEPSPDNFFSNFRKLNTAQPVNKGSFLKNNYEYIETPEESVLPENGQPFKTLANNGKQIEKMNPSGNFPNIIMNEEVDMPKVIPPFLEKPVKQKQSNRLKKLKVKPIPAIQSDEATNNNSVFNDNPIHPFTNNKNNAIEKPQINMQYKPTPDQNTVIQGNKLRLIKNSLQYINQILAMNEEVNSSSISYMEYTTSENINVNNKKTAKFNVIKQRKHKLITKMMVQSNHSDEKSKKKIKDLPADFIKEIAESVKNIILKDMKKEISTETPINSTTLLATKITTVETTITTTEKTTVATAKQEEGKTKDANYVVQKILELFKELKTGTSSTTPTTLIPTKLLEARVTKYVYSPSKNNQLPPMPAYNPYGIKPEIMPTNFTNPYNQVYKNPSLQPQMLNRTSDMMNQPQQMLNQPQRTTNQSPRILNHQLQTSNQPPQSYNRPQFMIKPPQPMILNQLPQSLPVTYQELQPSQFMNHVPQMTNQRLPIVNQPAQVSNQAPQTIYHYPPISNQLPQMPYEPVQMMNQPPIFTNPTLQNIYHYPQVLNRDAKFINQPSQIINQERQMVKETLQTLNRSPQMLNQPQQNMNNAQQILNQPEQIRNQAPQTLNNFSETFDKPSQMLNQAETPKIVNRFPQMFNQPSNNMNHAQQMLNQAQPMRNRAPQTLNNFSLTSPQMLNQAQLHQKSQILNRSPVMMNQPLQNMNREQQMVNQAEQMINEAPQISNQPTKNMNHAQQMLNQALQMKNQASQMTIDSPETSNQSPQIENHPQKDLNQGLQMGNQALLMMNTPEILNQQHKNTNRSPHMLNQAPHTIHQLSEAIDPVPQITVPLTNAFQSPPYVTIQTNSGEIPPLGIPMEKPKRLINQVIIVTTKGPLQIPKQVREQREPMKWLNEKRKEREQIRSDLEKKLRVSEILKRHESREPFINRSTKYRGSSFYKNYSGNHRETYRQRFRDKKPVYDRARPRHLAAKKFHEQLERIEDWSDRKKSRERLKDCCDDVPSRQQVPLTKMKQRTRYDDTHFKNFLKTQEKVNNMLEAILATKRAGRPRSVEIP